MFQKTREKVKNFFKKIGTFFKEKYQKLRAWSKTDGLISSFVDEVVFGYLGFLRVFFYVAVSAMLVLFYPNVAIAFVCVWIAKKAKNEYARVVLGAITGIVVAFLVLNFAEIAILVTTAPVHAIATAWGYSVAAA